MKGNRVTRLKHDIYHTFFWGQFTSIGFKMNDMSKLFKHVREASNFFYSYSIFFMYCFVSVRLWISHIHYAYKVPYYSLQQFFVIHPLVIFVNYSPLIVGLCSPK